jgi:hypothetical protein
MWLKSVVQFRKWKMRAETQASRQVIPIMRSRLHFRFRKYTVSRRPVKLLVHWAFWFLAGEVGGSRNHSDSCGMGTAVNGGGSLSTPLYAFTMWSGSGVLIHVPEYDPMKFCRRHGDTFSFTYIYPRLEACLWWASCFGRLAGVVLDVVKLKVKFSLYLTERHAIKTYMGVEV